MLIYDIEIKKAILGKGEDLLVNIDYCDGWDDHANMGVSCIGAYDYVEDRYRVFMDDNYSEFKDLIARRNLIIGFNNINFDNRVIHAYGLIDYTHEALQELEDKSYDLLQAIWQSATGVEGIHRNFDFKVHMGYGLDACIKANFPEVGGKTGHGALAPVDYQQKKFGSLVDYCLSDVWLTKMLFDQVRDQGYMTNPKTQSGTLIFPPIPDVYAEEVKDGS